MSSAYWLSQIRGIEKSLGIKRARLSQVQRIKGNLYNNYCFEVENINHCLTFSLTFLGSGIKKNNSFYSNMEEAESFYQSDSTSDGKLSAAIGHLEIEESNVVRDIQNAETALSNAQRRYEEALREEEEERRRQEEAARNAQAVQ